MADTPLHYLTIREASGLIQRGELSPVELTEAFLRRIEAVDHRLRAYVTVTADQARAEARAAETAVAQGASRGPLHGIPVAYKDLFDTAGVRTTGSSKLLEHRVPTADATVVARLRAAGAVMLGKLAMSEFAAGSNPSLFWDPANPWDLTRSPGGSSSGSGTATAAGLAMGTLGSDTGGSIRGPASFCGIVGLKPSYGLLSRYGVLPLSWSMDNAGPMTWTVEDTALMLQAMAGFDPHDPTTTRAAVPDYSAALREELSGLRVGVLRHLYHDATAGVQPDVVAAVDRAATAMEDLGAVVTEVELPVFRLAWIANTTILLTEGFAYHREHIRSRPQDYGDVVRTVMLMGGLATSADYAQAQRVRARMLREFARVMEQVDVLVMPTSSDVAPVVSDTSAAEQMVAGLLGQPSETAVGWTAPFNMLGAPAISIPCGFSEAGLPIGLQIAGKRLDEPTVLRAAYAYQEHSGWHRRRPPE